MTPVKVTVLASTLAIGGAEQLLYDLLRSLSPEIIQPDILYLREPGPIGQEIARLGIVSRQGFLRSRLDPAVLWRLSAQLRDNGTQVLLLINHLNALFYGVPAARLAGVGAVVNWHNETNRRYSPHVPVMFLRRIAHMGVDRIVAAARGHKDYIVAAEKVPPAKVEVIYNGVDTTAVARALPRAQAREKLSLPQDVPVVSIVAGLRPDKDHGVFLRAAKEVLRTLPGARFLIVGDGPQRGPLQALSRELGLNESVLFLGFRRDIPDILAATDVICLSSQPWQETLSVAMLEAMAAAIAPVVTDVGFLREIVHDGINGFLVPPGDPHALAGALARLLGDPALRKDFGTKAAGIVEQKCSIGTMARHFEQLFMQLAGKR